MRHNHFEARLWDSRLGRWLTTDPAGQYASPYLGMGNNPITSVDPDGKNTDDIYYDSETGKATVILTDDPFDRHFIDGVLKGYSSRGSWQYFDFPVIIRPEKIKYNPESMLTQQILKWLSYMKEFDFNDPVTGKNFYMDNLFDKENAPPMNYRKFGDVFVQNNSNGSVRVAINYAFDEKNLFGHTHFKNIIGIRYRDLGTGDFSIAAVGHSSHNDNDIFYITIMNNKNLYHQYKDRIDNGPQ